MRALKRGILPARAIVAHVIMQDAARVDADGVPLGDAAPRLGVVVDVVYGHTTGVLIAGVMLAIRARKIVIVFYFLLPVINENLSLLVRIS